MDTPPGTASPSNPKPRRGLWVFLLLVAGLPALFSAMVIPFSPSTALPWVLVSWPIVALSGYRIWRLDHPGESMRYEVRRRAKSLLGVAAVVGFTVAFQWFGMWIIGAVVVAGSIFLLVYAVASRNPPPAAAIPEVPPETQQDDPNLGSSPVLQPVPYATPSSGEDRRTDPPQGLNR
jgi:hypothetical protein